MATLLFVNDYNNYFNKTVKMDTLASVQSIYTCVTKTNRDFNPGDYVTTELIENWSESWNPNYVFVLDDAGTEIVSSWFIKSFDRTRGRQYHAELKRDSIRDHYENVINAPMIVNRAMLDENNPLLFNSEGFDFNQIKTREILLRDNYFMQWIYLYVAKGVDISTDAVTVKTDAASGADIVLSTTIENSIYSQGSKNGQPFNQEYEIWLDELYATFKIKPTFGDATTKNDRFRGYIEFDDNGSNGVFKESVNSSLEMYSSNDRLDLGTYSSINSQDTSTHGYFKNNDKLCNKVANLVYNNFLASNIGSHNAALDTDVNNPISRANELILMNANNKVVEDSTGKYYRVFVTRTKKSGTKTGDKTYLFASTIDTTLASKITYNANNSTYEANYDYYEYTVNYREEVSLNFSFNIQGQRNSTSTDYDIIAIPTSGLVLQTGPEDPDTSYRPETTLNGTYDFAMSIASAIAKQFTNAKIYDVQLLPYSPYNSFYSSGDLDVTNLPNGTSYQVLSDTGTGHSGLTTALFFLTDVNYTFDIYQSITINNFTDNVAINKKISNECDMYRLCSPNYNGVFEFSVAKNDGVSKFNIDMTLRPYQPYIHINPDFKGLYGQDFNDSRGLILGGDFSLPIINDKWQEYELNNKNYQQIFDREIKHMDFENKMARREAIASTIAGTVQGAATGAAGGSITGSMIKAAGGPVGLGIGAAVGLGSSLVGGAIDYSNLKKRQVENRDYAIDMFEYNLGNIKALPYSLSKSNPFSYNYKQFPFIEVYEATDAEKNILLNKIIYQSMNVNAIGTIADYKQSEPTFISGNIIRIEGGLDNHISEDIYNEIAKGVYI